jgi:hypothetical protein
MVKRPVVLNFPLPLWAVLEAMAIEREVRPDELALRLLTPMLEPPRGRRRGRLVLLPAADSEPQRRALIK